MACSYGDPKVVQHKIFLSHAGTEKDFVEQLYENLENIYPRRVFFDKDPSSLPHGENFAKHILYAVHNYEVAVIVISESYFKRKWPMIELAAFVSSQSQFPNLKILPLFYKLSVEEFKDRTRQDGWFEEWENFKDSRINEETLKAWKDALRSIYPLNGIQMIPEEGEVSYRKRIVRAICDMVPPVIEFDVSHVEGKDCICTFFREKLEPFDKNCSPCFFGLYAMGGMGKTTMSRVLCNEFSSEFLAKVCHVELNNHAIIDLRKALLRTLTKWNEIDMSKLTDEFQVRNLLIQHVPKHRLFLVVDNVWDQQNSREEAKSFLSLPFKKGSVVLVTARSIEILNLFKNIIPWKDCFSTPFLDTRAATNLFLNSTGYKSLSDLEPKEQALTTTFVDSCCFPLPGSLGGGEYHPLALRVLGGYVGQYTGPWENIKIDFKSLGENEKIDPLFSVLEIGWEGLSTDCRSLFLEIVQFTTDYRDVDTVEEFSKWYCAIFDVEEAGVREWLEILKRRSILNLEYRWGGWSFSIHDLYLEFATREANKWTHLRSCILHGGRHNVHYQRKRLAIRGSNIISLTEQELCECSTCVEILRVVDCDHLTKVDLRGMKDLLSIELLDCYSFKQVCLDDLQNLVWLKINTSKSSLILSMKGLVSLQVLKLCADPHALSDSQSTVCELSDLLHDCTSLLELEIKGYSQLLEFPDLSNSRKLRRFIGSYCLNTNSLPGLSNLEELRHLTLCDVGLIDIHGLDLLNKLEELDMSRCFHLKVIPNLENMGLTLRSLILQNCTNLEYFPSLNKLFSLQYLDISGCQKVQNIFGVDQLQSLIELDCKNTCIRHLPDLSMLTNLDSLDVSCTPIVDIGNLPTNLKCFLMVDCPYVKKLPNISQPSRLEYLDLFGCKQFEEIHGVHQLRSLTKLNCKETSIGHLPNLSMLTNLVSLDVSRTPIVDIENLPTNLRLFSMNECPNVKQLPNLSQLSRLEYLDLFRCEQIEDIHGVHQLRSLKELNCRETRIGHLPDLSMLTNLVSLDVSRTPIVDIENLPTNLMLFSMNECPYVKQLPNLSQLRSLKELNCRETSIGHLPDLSMLTNLVLLDVSRTPIVDIENLPTNLMLFSMNECPNVKQLPNLSQLSRLEYLDLFRCKQFEEIHGVHQLRSLINLNCRETRIGHLPDLSMLTNLVSLDVSRTPIVDIENLPTNLMLFSMNECPNVKQLPNLSQLSRLEYLDLFRCKQIEDIHGVHQLQSLKELKCKETSIGHLPNLSMLTNLDLLDVSGTPIVEVENLPTNLKYFSMNRCPNVKELPNLSQLGHLKYLRLFCSKQIKEIHGVNQLQNLKGLNCGGTSINYLPDLSMLTNLNWLDVSGTPIVHIGNLPTNLKYFSMNMCPDVEQLPNLNQLGRLESLELFGSKQIKEIHGVEQLQSLIKLKCKDTNIGHLPDLSMLTNLDSLDVSGTPIVDIGNLPTNLKCFLMVDCPYVKKLPNISQPNRLEYLDLSGCEQVQEVHGVDQLQNLKDLICSGTSIRSLPDLSMLANLGFINVSQTPIQHIGGLPKNLENFHMYDCGHAEELSNSVAYKTWTSLGANKFKKSRH